ncbi:MAG: thiamine-phosphate kinase, partial [Promethearchaeota archaeon]
MISIIEKIIIEKKVKKITRDDCFYFNLKDYIRMSDLSRMLLVMNSDMLVSTTDFPPYMNYFQFGLRAVISNISDLIVKGVKPKGIILSLGIPNYLNLDDFKNIIKGIVNSCNKYDLDYIGGDLNETKEIIISPTVFGFQENNKIIPREGIEVGDILVANGKFGLTGVGFDILLNQNNYESLKKRYKQSIQSVLEPDILGFEGLLIAEKKLASGSIDSSDGLAKSLLDLMQVNKNIGFEINF